MKARVAIEHLLEEDTGFMSRWQRCWAIAALCRAIERILSSIAAASEKAA
jgi:hypothetical protein